MTGADVLMSIHVRVATALDQVGGVNGRVVRGKVSTKFLL